MATVDMYPIHAVPDDNPDEAMREARSAELTRQLRGRMDEVWDETLSRLTDASNAAGNPVHERLKDLVDRPLEDVFELAGWQRYLPTRTKLALGEAVIDALGRGQLAVARRVMDVAF
jgi:hypothetical protein